VTDLTDLQLLYTEDPLNLTRADIDRLIEDLRKKGRAFDEAGKPTKAAGGKAKADKSLGVEIEL
jgi:hypothetical protein